MGTVLNLLDNVLYVGFGILYLVGAVRCMYVVYEGAIERYERNRAA